jgi:hypothetical protein
MVSLLFSEGVTSTEIQHREFTGANIFPMTVSRVRGFTIWLKELLVMFFRAWPIKSGSPNEIVVLILFDLIA